MRNEKVTIFLPTGEEGACEVHAGHRDDRGDFKGEKIGTYQPLFPRIDGVPQLSLVGADADKVLQKLQAGQGNPGGYGFIPSE